MPTSNPFDDFDDFAPSEPSAPAGHVPDRAGHPGRRVRARVADMIGGGDSYAGPKAEKPAKAPLRDRIADKIATKPKGEEAPAGVSEAGSGAGTKPHEHDDWCDSDCTRKTEPANPFTSAPKDEF